MRISIGTGWIMPKFTPEKIVDLLSDAGFDCIDFAFESVYSPLDPNTIALSRDFDCRMKNLREYAQSKGMTYNQAHAPFPTSCGDKEKDKVIFEAVVRSMEISSLLGVENIVVHPVQHIPYLDNEEESLAMNLEFYSSLAPYCREFNIKVAVENIYQYDALRGGPVCCPTSRVDNLNYFMDNLPGEHFTVCLDMGHTAITGENVETAIRKLGHDRLGAVHVHDVDYKRDCHNLPGLEKLDFGKITQALSEIKYKGDFTLETDNFFKGFEDDFLPVVLKFTADRARYIANKIEL